MSIEPINDPGDSSDVPHWVDWIAVATVFATLAAMLVLFT